MLVDFELDQMIDHVPPGPSGTGGLGLDGRVTLTDIAHGWTSAHSFKRDRSQMRASEMRHDDDDDDEKKRTCGTL
jgi:hypothetical protein